MQLCQQESWTDEEQTSERKGVSLFLTEWDWPEAIQAQMLRKPMTAEACEGSLFLRLGLHEKLTSGQVKEKLSVEFSGIIIHRIRKEHKEM